MMSAPPDTISGGLGEEIECWKCQEMTDMRFIFAYQEGHPLCSKCFHEIVEMQKKSDEELR